VAFLLGMDPESQAAYFFAVGFTLIAAFFFSSLRDKRMPPEAAIGVVFAVASALCVLIADKIPHGSEHLKYILNGDILWVSWPHLAKTAVIYSILGILHYRLRDRFFLISSNPAEAEKRGLSVRRWDFLFYLTFGLVITSSVQIAGVLLVFSFLIVPALIARLFTQSAKSQLLGGWAIGTLVSSLGLWASYRWDLPTGSAIVAGFGLAFLVSLVVRARR
jgi:zinc/manganese transport system permease protein